MSPSAPQPLIRLGTRGSQLARWQADWVADQLRRQGCSVETIEISTRGDRDQTSSLEQIGGIGVFTKELQRALLLGEIDLAVHSLKDLPTTPVEGLTLAAVPARENPFDVFVSNVAPSLDQLPPESRVGTGSLRRQAQLAWRRPDLVLDEVRGNVDTRLRKLDAGEYDALILAAAGLTRLGLVNRITEYLPPKVLLPAAGQGALGIECRAGDTPTLAAVAGLHHAETAACVTAERTLLAGVEGGCLAAIGAHATCAGERLSLQALVLSADGARQLAASGEEDLANASALAKRLADELLAAGAAELLLRR
jgi:hydroxymethylbilane synthase